MATFDRKTGEAVDAALGELVRDMLLVRREDMNRKVLGRLAILVRHIYPHLLATMAVYISLGIATTVLFEAGLRYLGVGVPHGTPSWGGMISDNHDAVTTAPWLVFGPGAAIVITVVAFNLLGDGLRDALDPYKD